MAETTGNASDGSLPHLIRCEVVFAIPDRQVIVALQVSAGTTAIEAVKLSGIASEFPGEDFSAPDLGIFSLPVDSTHVLEEGDRVEIYRPLQADPKEVRRALAALGQTIGGREGLE